ncbi:MAG TPA: ABC transporter permease [Gemmatimonadaceae bacterium]
MRRRRRFFWHVPVDTEVEEEIAAHIALQTQRYVSAGIAESEARARALGRFGDLEQVRSECKDIRQHMEADVRRAEFADELRQDARFAFRTLRKNPLFTVVAALTIALGVGANTAIFSVVDAVLLRSLPYPNAERTVFIDNAYGPTTADFAAVSAPEYFDYADQLRSLDGIAAFRPRAMPITSDGAEPEQLNAYVVTPNLFRVLGTRPAIGRDFAADEGAPGGPLMVVLSHALWTRRFGGDSSIIGRTANIGGVSRTVIGIMPPGIRFPDDAVGYAKAPADVWIPATLADVRTPQNRGNQNLVVIGHLRPNVTTEMLAADVRALERQLKSAYPDRYASTNAKSWHVVALPLRDQMVGTVRPALVLLSVAVGLVLLIVCANVANLLLARGALRQREMAVRLALGANRRRLLRQLLTESVVLALGGGILGAGLAWAGVRLLLRAAPIDIPRLHETHVDATVLLFSLAVSLIAGVLVGLFPALQQSRADLRDTLSDGARGSGEGKARRRTRTMLVVAEVAMALVILNAAGLLIRSFTALQRVDPGFAPHGVMSMYLSLPRATYDSGAKIAHFYRELQTHTDALPGVRESSGIQPLPMDGDGWSGSFDIEGRPTSDIDAPHAEFAAALPGYFATMGIPILQGRDFVPQDDASAAPVVIVDELLAKRYWPNESALGKRINALENAGMWETVVGVAKHVRSRGPQEAGEPQLYASYLQHPQGMISMVTRSARHDGVLDVATSANALRAAVRELDHNLPVSKLNSMDEVVSLAIARQRFNMLMIALFGVAALGLASVGLYGVMAYLVAQRTHEIGIRVALGGQPSDVRRLVLRESMMLAATGVVVGTAITLAISGTLGKLLYGVSPTDPITYAAIAGLLLVVAGGAAYGPARRATRVDPMVALRE